MSNLSEAVLHAITKYDEILHNQAGTSSSAEEAADDAEVAAHECVAEIREALEADAAAVDEVNLNNPIAKLQERAQIKRLRMPVYTFTQSGEPHIPKMTATCVSEGITAKAEGPNKQTAKRRAARIVLEHIYGVKS